MQNSPIYLDAIDIEEFFTIKLLIYTLAEEWRGFQMEKALGSEHFIAIVFSI